jgi:hypothetical protein
MSININSVKIYYFRGSKSPQSSLVTFFGCNGCITEGAITLLIIGAIVAIDGGVALRAGDITSDEVGLEGKDGMEECVVVEGGIKML